ncbi:MAG: hypothetical protein HQ517_08975, partial [SAR324 cluster bacterium]|nr:hypothetical protein [SAR324 cluster bacterium]
MQKKHFFPLIPHPLIARISDNSALEIKSKQIVISEHFVDINSQYLQEEKIIEALLDHSVAHYTICPWDFRTYMTLYMAAKNVLENKSRALVATSYFTDVVADTHCFMEKDTPLADLYRHMKGKQTLDLLIHALFQKTWGVDLNVIGFEQFADRLAQIPYLDKSQWSQSIHKFCKIIIPFLPKFENVEIASMGNFGMRDFTRAEILDGLSEFAFGSQNPEEFQKLMEDFADDLSEEFEDEVGMGLSFTQPSDDANPLFYMRLADNYSLPLNNKPIKKSGTLHPHGHVPWELGRPFMDIDPWTSFGKFMPGITQVWEKREGDIVGNEEGAPNCIVMIDSSGSMTNPREYLSYAVLGAGCAADAYLRNDATVAIYNFADAKGGQSWILPYTRERGKIYETICHYFAGGTRLNFADIEKLNDLSTPDIFIITDLKILNIKDLIEYLNTLKNRVTVVHIGDNEQVNQFKQSTQAKEHINIFFVQRTKDIPKIVLGQIGEY